MKKIKKILKVIMCIIIMQAIVFQGHAMTEDGTIDGRQTSWFPFSTITKAASSVPATFNRLYYTYWDPIQDGTFERKVLEFYNSNSDVRNEMMYFINNHVNNDNVNFKARFDVTLMHAACRKGYLDVVQCLLELGGDINGLKLDETKMTFRNISSQQPPSDAFYGSTPFHLTMMKGHYDVFVFLLAHGADIEATDRCGHDGPGRTALHVASSHGTVRMVDDLLNAGAIINAICNESTSLELANHFGKTEIADFLREKGANTLREIDNAAKRIKINSINQSRSKRPFDGER